MKPRTRAAHPPKARLEPDNRPLVEPIHQSVKFSYPELAAVERAWRHESGGYHYSRAGNPTTRALELAVADMQGTEDALAVGSGMAAVSATLLALLKAGDRVLMFYESYVPTRRFAREVLARYGVSLGLVSIDDRAGIERELGAARPALVWFESPTNPMLKIPDIAALVRAAREAGALSVLDNTFAGLHQHGDCGVDLYVHSLTKYASGHGDVLAGAVAGPARLVERVRHDATLLGPTLDAHAAFLVSRGLKTYYLRREAACAGAAAVAAYLERHPLVERVHYPGLASHPGHALACRQMADFGAVVTFELRGTPAQARAFTQALDLFTVAASLGSTESLIVPPQLIGSAGLSGQALDACGITPTTTRLSIGLEDAQDLIADLEQGFAAVSAAK